MSEKDKPQPQQKPATTEEKPAEPPAVEHPEAAEIPPPPGLITGDEHGEVQDEVEDK